MHLAGEEGRDRRGEERTHLTHFSRTLDTADAAALDPRPCALVRSATCALRPAPLVGEDVKTRPPGGAGATDQDRGPEPGAVRSGDSSDVLFPDREHFGTCRYWLEEARGHLDGCRRSGPDINAFYQCLQSMKLMFSSKVIS